MSGVFVTVSGCLVRRDFRSLLRRWSYVVPSRVPRDTTAARRLSLPKTCPGSVMVKAGNQKKGQMACIAGIPVWGFSKPAQGIQN